MSKGLLCIDFINDIVHPDGKLAGVGYGECVARRNTLNHLAAALEHFRRAGAPVVHVRVGFSPNYCELPRRSPLFGQAEEFGALMLGGWGTQFVGEALPTEGECVITKRRISAFHATELDLVLRTLGVDELFIAGVSTDLAVEAAVRDAHDRDYQVNVLENCCAAADDAAHAAAMNVIAAFGSVITDTADIVL